MGVKKLDESPYLLVCVEFAIAVAIALFFISMVTNNFMALPAQAALLLLMILCIPLLLIIYWTTDDAPLKSVLRGVLAFFFIQIISGTFWYVLPQLECLSFIYTTLTLLEGAMLLMPLAYLPLLYGLTTAVIRHKPVPSHLLYLVGGICLVAMSGVSVVLGFYALNNLNAIYSVLIFGSAVIGDVLVAGLCALLITANLKRVTGYLFGILLVSFSLSYIGDTLGAFSGLGLYDASNYAQIMYSVTMAFITVALLLYSMGSVNRRLLDRLNRELYDTRRLVDDLLRNTPDAMCVTEIDGTAIRANKQFCQILGRTMDETVGVFNLFSHSYWLSQDLIEPAHRLKGGTPTTLNHVRAGREGMIFRLKMFPTFSAAGAVSSYMIVMEDVTDIEQAREALKRAHDELEFRVQQRTLELAKVNSALVGEIDEHRQARENLQTSLAEKQLLLKEVHHRVKNNLQIVTSLLNLRVADIRDPYDIRIFRESQNRIRSIALVHENIYQSDDLSQVTFDRYVDLLVRHLYNIYHVGPGYVELTVAIPEIRIKVDTAITCGLIINELISAALDRHLADEQKGELYLGLHGTANGEVTLEVRDNWLSDAAIGDGKSIASDLVEVLVGQLDGSLSVELANGISYTIVFNI